MLAADCMKGNLTPVTGTRQKQTSPAFNHTSFGVGSGRTEVASRYQQQQKISEKQIAHPLSLRWMPRICDRWNNASGAKHGDRRCRRNKWKFMNLANILIILLLGRVLWPTNFNLCVTHTILIRRTYNGAWAVMMVGGAWGSRVARRSPDERKQNQIVFIAFAAHEFHV